MESTTANVRLFFKRQATMLNLRGGILKIFSKRPSLVLERQVGLQKTCEVFRNLCINGKLRIFKYYREALWQPVYVIGDNRALQLILLLKDLLSN
jgi:hypothetical protein